MSEMGDGKRQEIFSQALKGKRIPILTLDNKWYQLLTEESRAAVSGLEEELNGLLKQQGRLNTEIKEIKRVKKKLMGEIVSLADEAVQEGDAAAEQKIDQNKRLVEECNEKLDGYQDELLDLPKRIEEVNFQLMLATMECCYGTMQENTDPGDRPVGGGDPDRAEKAPDQKAGDGAEEPQYLLLHARCVRGRGDRTF